MKKMLTLSSIIFLVAFTLMGCANNAVKSSMLEIDYLGETPPGDVATLFSPSGYLSNEEWHWHGTPVFSPDGKEMYFAKYMKAADLIEIWYAVKGDAAWSEAKKLPLVGLEGTNNNPVLSDDGNTLYILNFKDSKFTIYQLTREANDWINPIAINLDIPFGKVLGWQYSISQNKNLYFLLWDLNGVEHQKIYMASYNNGAYGKPVPLDILDINSNGVGGPLIAADESYIIFDSERTEGEGMHDLYISFKDANGNFTAPISLGNQVNSDNEDSGATLSPDGLYLFYTTQKNGDKGYNPYWIKLSEIEPIKTH